MGFPLQGSSSGKMSHQSVWLFIYFYLFSEHVTLKDSQAYFQESQRDVGNRLCSYRSCVTSHCAFPGTGSNMKGALVRPTCWPWKPLREAGGNWDSPWAYRHWWKAFWGDCSTTSTRVLGKHHLVLSSTSTRWWGTGWAALALRPSKPCTQLPWDPTPSPTTSRPAASRPGAGSQPGQEPAPTTSMPARLSPPT